MEEIEFHHSLPIQLRFNDVDKFGHVNNTVYFHFTISAKQNISLLYARESTGKKTAL